MTTVRRLVPALLVVLVACGGGGDAADLGPAPTRPATTDPAVPAQTTEVDLYLVRGERLERVRRAVPKVARIGAEAVKALLAGPTAAEAAGGLRSAIPPDTRFRDLTITDGVARIDLSRTFETGSGSTELTLRLAQVTCTLDQFDTVTGVRFVIDGRSIDVFSSAGIVVAGAVACRDYAEYQARSAQEVFPGVWPFTSLQEVRAAESGSDPTWRDPEATARVFAERYLRLTDPVTFGFRSTGPGAGEVPLGFSRGEGGAVLADPKPTTVVSLRQLGRQGEGGVWTVTGATAPDLVVESPPVLSRVASPVTVRGRARVFEGTVHLEVREDGMVAGQSLGTGFATAGGGDTPAPFSTTIAFRPPSKPAGALVALERSSATGGSPVLRAAVVRVAF